jgi:ElaA protein
VKPSVSQFPPEPLAETQDVRWLWRSFAELDTRELYDLLALRSQVFVVEQTCVFLDPDGLDLGARHILGYQCSSLVAYGRFLPEGLWRPAVVSLGRLVTAPAVRGTGIGIRMLHFALQQLAADGNLFPIQLEAQARLRAFYERFGFQATALPHIHDGQLHVMMIRPPGPVNV